MKVLEVAAAPTITEGGTRNAAVLLTSVTVMPPEGAALLSVTVHWLEAFWPILAGLHESEDTKTGAVKLMMLFTELTPSVAVRVVL